MARRRPDALFAGAKGTTTLRAAAALGPRHAVQVKHDGCYVITTTDARGYVEHMRLRSGESVPAAVLAEFRGVRWAPSCVLATELDLWTERSRRVVEARGYRCAHILDALRIDGRAVDRMPQRERRDLLMRAESRLVQDDDDRPWVTDDRQRTHDLATGRYNVATPRSWRRLPVTEQWPIVALERVWGDRVIGADGEEGLVIVAIDAPVGRTNAKRKLKRLSTIDAVIVARDSSAAIVAWNGRTFPVSCRGKANAAIAVGDVVEILCDSFTERTSEPRHPRILRARPDLGRSAACS